MANTSATGGFVQPGPAIPFSWDDPHAGWGTGLWDDVPPLAGADLYRFLHAMVAGISGLPGNMVLPRWQPEPANLPDGDWAAFGVIRRVARGMPYIDHDPAGRDRYQRHETLECLVSFYGDNADMRAGTLRDGLYVPQNNEPLLLAGFGLIGADEIVAIPSLVKQRWLYRADLTFTLRRAILRSYPILDIERVQARVISDEGTAASANVPAL
jgi:hypothetical protein